MRLDWLANEPLISALILGIAVASSACWIVLDSLSRGLLIQHWKIICGVILLTIAWRASTANNRFYGLEYEDSYIYNVAGRQAISAQDKPDNRQSDFLIEPCAVGSLDSCYLSETSSGHYIGFPTIIRSARGLFADRWKVNYYLNLLACCISALFVFLICRLITGVLAAPLAGCVIFATTPAFAVYGVASFAEPASNAFVSIILYLYLRYFSAGEESGKARVTHGLALITALLAAILIKRENVVLPIGITLVGTITIFSERAQWRTQVSPLVASVIALVNAIGLFHITRTLVQETSEFSGFPFGISNMLSLVPSLLTALLSPWWYSGTVILVIWGSINGWRLRTAAAPISALMVAYAVLYTSHARSGAQVHGAFVGPDQMLRYLTNLMTIWSILAGLGFAAIVGHLANVQRKAALAGTAIFALFLYAICCYVITVHERRHLSRQEFELRIGPALEASRMAQRLGTDRTYIVTREPLTIQMFAPSSTNALSLNRFNKHLIAMLQNESPDLQLLYLKQSSYDSVYETDRFAIPLECISNMENHRLLESKEFAVVQLDPARAGACR